MGRRRRRGSSSDGWISSDDFEAIETAKQDMKECVEFFFAYKKDALRQERLWEKRHRLKRMDVELTDEEDSGLIGEYNIMNDHEPFNDYEYVEPFRDSEDEDEEDDEEEEEDEDEEEEKSVTYVDNVKTRHSNWEKRRKSVFFNILDVSTIYGKTCSADCNNEAEALCTVCTKDEYFCSAHALYHNINLRHAVRRNDGRYVGSEKPLEKDGTVRKNPPLMIMEFGWFYDRRPIQEIMADPKWFPLTPEKPSTFIFHQTMQSSANQLKVFMLSAQSIMDGIEANHSIPPPKKWRNNFAEALRTYAAWQVQLNNAKTEIDLNKGETACRVNCPACFSNSKNGGSIILVNTL